MLKMQSREGEAFGAKGEGGAGDLTHVCSPRPMPFQQQKRLPLWLVLFLCLTLPFKNMSVVEIKITKYKINYFEVYNSVVFNIFTVLCNHHPLVRCFHRNPSFDLKKIPQLIANSKTDEIFFTQKSEQVNLPVIHVHCMYQRHQRVLCLAYTST